MEQYVYFYGSPSSSFFKTLVEDALAVKTLTHGFKEEAAKIKKASCVVMNLSEQLDRSLIAIALNEGIPVVGVFETAFDFNSVTDCYLHSMFSLNADKEFLSTVKNLASEAENASKRQPWE